MQWVQTTAVAPLPSHRTPLILLILPFFTGIDHILMCYWQQISTFKRFNKSTFKHRFSEKSIEAFATNLSGANWLEIFDNVSSLNNLVDVNIIFKAVLEIVRSAFFTLFSPVKAFSYRLS